MPRAHQIAAHVLTRADQITKRLLGNRRDPREGQFARGQQPRQADRVTPVGLDPIRRRFGTSPGVVTRRSIPASRAARASPNPVGSGSYTARTPGPRRRSHAITGSVPPASLVTDSSPVAASSSSRPSPTTRALAVPRSDLWEACFSNMRQVVDRLIDPAVRTLPFLTFITSSGRQRVQQGVPVDALLHAYQIGTRMIWEGLVQEARRRGDLEAEPLCEATTLVWDLYEATCGRIVTAYREAEQALARRDELRRTELIEGLLAGRGCEPGFALTASAGLELRPRGRYAVIVAEPGALDVHRHSRVAGALSGHELAAVWRTGPTQLTGIVDLGQVSIETLVRVLRPLAKGAVSLSSAVDALSRLPLAHQLATITLSTMPSGKGDVATVEHRLAVALLAANPQVSTVLVEHVLGAVRTCAEPERERLLDTVRAYFEAGGSSTGAAEALGCHRNTVRKRLRRMEALPGRSLTDPAELLLVSLAVHATALDH